MTNRNWNTEQIRLRNEDVAAALVYWAPPSICPVRPNSCCQGRPSSPIIRRALPINREKLTSFRSLGNSHRLLYVGSGAFIQDIGAAVATLTIYRICKLYPTHPSVSTVTTELDKSSYSDTNDTHLIPIVCVWR